MFILNRPLKIWFWNPEFVQVVLFDTAVDPERQTKIAAKGVPLGYNSV